MAKRRGFVNVAKEKARMREHAELRIAFESDFKRGRGPGQGHILSGPWGCAIWEEIQGRFAAGNPKTILVDADSDTYRETGRYERWDQLAAVARLHQSLLMEAAKKRALLYREPVEISGGVVTPLFSSLRKSWGIDKAFQRRQLREFGTGAAVMRPRFRRDEFTGKYYPVGAAVVWPENCIAIRNPAAPDELVFFAERCEVDGREFWEVHDLTNLTEPYIGRWPSLEAWQQGWGDAWIRKGVDYPFWWNGVPHMGPVAYQGVATASDEALPILQGAAQAVKDLTIKDIWLQFVTQIGSFNSLVVLGEEKAGGLDKWVADPMNIKHAWGPGLSVDEAKHSLDAAALLKEFYAQDAQEWLNQVNSRLEVRQASTDSAAAKSGVALLIELTGLVQEANERETAVAPLDKLFIQSMIAGQNYLTRSGQTGYRQTPGGVAWWPQGGCGAEFIIPESDIRLTYPRKWNEVERKRIFEEMMELSDRGIISVVEAAMFALGIENDGRGGANWQTMEAELMANLEDARRLAQAGYGLRWSERARQAAATEVDEAVVYTPTSEVADEASSGLILRDAFPGRALRHDISSERKLYARAKKLRDRGSFSEGDLRTLNLWLQKHAGGEGEEAEVGEWGNDSDPSSAWITWRSQGGDAALDWTEIELAREGGLNGHESVPG